MSLTLYKASADLAALLDQVDPETGELPEGLGHARDLVASRGAAVAAVIANTELQIDAVEARLKEAKKAVDGQKKRMEWLRAYLLENMAKAGITEIKSDDKLLTVKRLVERDKSVDIFDAKQLPRDVLRLPPIPEPSPDKAQIKKLLEDGQDVPGARIVARDRLVIA